MKFKDFIDMSIKMNKMEKKRKKQLPPIKRFFNGMLHFFAAVGLVFVVGFIVYMVTGIVIDSIYILNLFMLGVFTLFLPTTIIQIFIYFRRQIK